MYANKETGGGRRVVVVSGGKRLKRYDRGRERERREAHITYREEGGGMKDKQRRLEKRETKTRKGRGRSGGGQKWIETQPTE